MIEIFDSAIFFEFLSMISMMNISIGSKVGCQKQVTKVQFSNDSFFLKPAQPKPPFYSLSIGSSVEQISCRNFFCFLFLQLIAIIDLLLIFVIRMKSQDNGEQGCNFQDDFQILLSQRMDLLNISPIKVKPMLSIQESNPNPTSQPQPHLHSASDGERNKENHMNKPVKKIVGESTSIKGSRFKRISETKRQRSPVMQNIRLFQVTEGGNRRAVLTQVKDMRISDFTGRGLLLLPNNKKYQGEWVQGNLVGDVKITYPNGDIYLGGIYNYEKHGKGYMYFVSGEKFVGEFSSGDFHGQGTFFDKTGKVLYEGEWRRGKMLNR